MKITPQFDTSTLTDHGVLVGSGTDPVTALAVGTNGQVLLGSTGADPVFATITDGEGIDTTPGAGTLTIACEDASTSNKGILVTAGSTKALAGTDTASAMTPADVQTVRVNERTREAENFIEDLSWFPPVTFTWDPGELADGAGETSTGQTVPGAALGSTIVMVSAPYDLQDMTVTAYLQAANTVEVRIQNESGGTINLASGTWLIQCRRV